MATQETFDSLADAARASFPTSSTRIVAIRESGDAGYALFDTAPSGSHYLYGVHYARIDGRWIEGVSSNGPSWSSVGRDPNLGTFTDWDVAPAGADRVRIQLGDDIREEAVENDIYLVVWWQVPVPIRSVEHRSFRIGGRWR